MKRTFATLLAAAVITAGCATPPSQCAEAAERYTAIMARLEAGNVVSPEDIERAKLAADVLVLSCGWTRTRAAIQGVPVIRPTR